MVGGTGGRAARATRRLGVGVCSRECGGRALPVGDRLAERVGYIGYRMTLAIRIVGVLLLTVAAILLFQRMADGYALNRTIPAAAALIAIGAAFFVDWIWR